MFIYNYYFKTASISHSTTYLKMWKSCRKSIKCLHVGQMFLIFSIMLSYPPILRFRAQFSVFFCIASDVSKNVYRNIRTNWFCSRLFCIRMNVRNQKKTSLYSQNMTTQFLISYRRRCNVFYSLRLFFFKKKIWQRLSCKPCWTFQINLSFVFELRPALPDVLLDTNL